ncbi:hypothetical protein AD2_01656 [Acetivibrio thermocellus AD2]|nr:hypothetical protein AD2_01656 [Acetivibrio thermocellus AD2]ANV76398.1 hypothetical protein LQRI_1657 [Acetivibrio thermocellus DSM 2360]EIC05360.1 hypothetical protein YSBL_0967 [Acetivibrio thermocellus YS]
MGAVAGFSIPHRYDTNEAIEVLSRKGEEFSIPHRYDTNSGRMGSYRQCRQISIPHRYDTNLDSHARLPVQCFQISIPHRYDTNELQVYQRYCSNLISIPHRYDTNHLVAIKDHQHFLSFQFLIGTIQTG